MGNEVAPEFVPNQSLSFPATTNHFGYCYTGTEQPYEWNDQRRYFDLNAQNLQSSGLRTESFPYVPYPANYEYAQSVYNPYNPYIPGAVVGIDGQHMGSQQYLNGSSFQQTVSPTALTPYVVQSSSNMAPYASPGHFPVGTAGGRFIPPVSPVSTIPLKASLPNQAFEPFQPSQQIPIDLRSMNGSVVNAAPSMPGALTSGIAPYMTQGLAHSSHQCVQSGRVPVQVAMPVNNGIANLGPSGWAPVGRIRPRAQLNGTFSSNLAVQNIGPRMNRSRAQLTLPLMSRAYLTGQAAGNLDGNVIVHSDQYNREDFPEDYKDAKFFVIKSYSEDDVHKSIKYNVWSSTSSGNKKLDRAYGEAQNEKPSACPVFLLFSVNASGHFCGVAEMIGPVDFHKDMDFWLQDKWTGSFPVRWHIVKDVPNSGFRGVVLENNENRPVTGSRDTQEVPFLPGMSMLAIFKNSPMTTSILDDYMYFEERQRDMQEKKSRFLSRTDQTSVCLPASTTPDSEINQLTGTDEERPIDTVVQAPDFEQKEPITKEPTPASDGKAEHTVDQDTKTEESLQNIACCKPLSHENQLEIIRNQPSGGNDDLSSNANPPSSDGIQLNGEVDQHRETSGKQFDRSVDSNDSCKSDPSQDEQDAKPECVGDSRDASETEETDVTEFLTIGSLQIKISKSCSSSFTGTVTIGSVGP